MRTAPDLTAVAILTHTAHGSAIGVYACRLYAGASTPVEAHPYEERIVAGTPLRVAIGGVVHSLGEGSEVTIPASAEHQVITVSRGYPAQWIAVLTPDHDDPSLADLERVECAACGADCDATVGIHCDGPGVGEKVPLCETDALIATDIDAAQVRARIKARRVAAGEVGA